MHPPPFHLDQRLSDWPECRLELRCPACGSCLYYPTAMMRTRHGDRTFRKLLPRLKCQRCGVPPSPVYLLAGHHREFCYGAEPDWAIELVPVARVASPAFIRRVEKKRDER